jgi:hypothetical protein
MKNILSFLGENSRLALYPSVDISGYTSNKVIPFNTAYYSFNGVGVSTKYIPSEADVIGFSGGNQIPDNDSGKKEVLNTYWNEHSAEGKCIANISGKTRSIWVWVASTSIILIFAFSIIQNHIRNRVIDKTFQLYYTLPDLSALTSRESNFAAYSVWGGLMSAYNQRNFDLIRDHFRFVPVKSPIYKYSLFLNGICLIQDHQYQRALETFEALQGNVNLISEVNWYAGLCYIKLGNLHSAALLFQNIKKESIYEKKAAEIVQKIKTVK